MIPARIVLAATLVAACGLSACGTYGGLRSPQVALPGAFEAGSAATTAITPAALDRWWLLFNDTQLTALEEEALRASPDARTAKAKLREAGAIRFEGIYALFPQGDVKGTATDSTTKTSYKNIPPSLSSFLNSGFSQSGDGEVRSASFQPSWELDFFGRDLAAAKTANADYAAARFNAEAAYLTLTANVATSLFQARGLAVQLADARDSAATSARLAEAGRLKLFYGLSAGSEAARLDSDAATSAAQVLALQAQLASAKRSLLILLGRGAAPSADLAVEATIALAPDVPAVAPGELLARRPDVREAEARVHSAAGRLTTDRLAVLPTVTLLPALQYNQSTYSYTTTNRINSLAVGVSVPLLSLPRILAEARAQGARGEQAVIAYEKSVQSAYGDAEKALSSLAADRARVGKLREATERSRYAFDAADTGYRLGLTDLTTLIQSEQAWRQAKGAYATAGTAALQDAVSAFKALGGGWSPGGYGPAPQASGGTK